MNSLYLFIYLLAIVCFSIGTFLTFTKRAAWSGLGFLGLGLVFVTLVRIIQLSP